VFESPRGYKTRKKEKGKAQNPKLKAQSSKPKAKRKKMQGFGKNKSRD
jgi:hypothetical protein